MSKKTLSEKPLILANDGGPKTAAPDLFAAPGQPGETDVATMARYGITRRPVDYFHVGAFRYTSLADAVAEAKRMARAAPVEGNAGRA